MPIADDKKYRNLVFTWNNYPEDWDVQVQTQLPWKYLIAARETAPTTGTAHIQGYVEFKSQVRGRTLKDRFPDVWFAARRGSPMQAADYCKKADPDALEMGEISHQGKRTDVENVRDALVEDNATIRDVVLSATSMQAIRFAEVFLKYHEKKRCWRPKVYWFFGAAGSGKSALAHALAKREDLDLFEQGSNGKWWEGYDAHTAVLIDDIRSTFLPFADMLKLLDRYSMRIECKGGSRELRATHMYITAPYPPDQIWDTREDMAQLTRRIDHIWEIKSCDTIINHQGPEDAIPTISQEEWFPPPPADDQEDEGESSDQEVREEGDSSAEAGDEDGADISGRTADELSEPDSSISS